jgi:predicted ATP-dependent protease
MLVSIKPEPIPLDLKVLIIGNSNIYHTLLSMDDDFRKLFKIKVEFEEDAPKNVENMQRLSNFVHSFCMQEGLLDLDKEAMAKVIEFSSKLSGDKEKLSTQFSEIGEIVGEASAWAKLGKSKIITKEYVQKALNERIDRIKKYDKKYIQMIKEDGLSINTTGVPLFMNLSTVIPVQSTVASTNASTRRLYSISRIFSSFSTVCVICSLISSPRAFDLTYTFSSMQTKVST